jgi:hypothetical protein
MSDNLKKGKYMDKNKNNDRRWDVFKTISNVIIKVLAIFVAGTIVTFAVPVTIINIFQGNNPTNSSSIIEDLKTSKIENSILEVYDSSQGVADGNYGNAIVIDEVYTLYKRTMTQLECMETSFFPYGYQSPDVTMVGYGERIVVKNYFDVDDNIDYNNIYFSANFYNEKNELLEYDDYPFGAYLSTEADKIEMIFSIKEPIKSGRYSCEFIIYENAAKELDSIYIIFDVL